MKNKGLEETILCKHLLVIKSEKSNISPPAVIPNNKLKNMHVRIAFIACLFLFKANFSETITVTAMFIQMLLLL